MVSGEVVISKTTWTQRRDGVKFSLGELPTINCVKQIFHDFLEYSQLVCLRISVSFFLSFLIESRIFANFFTRFIKSLKIRLGGICS